MDKNVFSDLILDNYKVDYVEYQSNNSFHYVDPIDIDLGLKVKVEVDEDNNNGNVTLVAKIFENAVEKNFPFSINISLTGYFKASDGMEKEDFMKYCQLNGTAALFPLLRSAIADITKAANEQPLVLPLINVYKFIESSKEELPKT